MDPSAIIATALNSGVSAISTGAASATVVKAYDRLRTELSARLANKAAVATLFDEVEDHPDRADILIHRLLRDERARLDDELLQRAMDLLNALSDTDARRSKYRVDVRSSQGVQIGNHNVQTNTFSVGEDQAQ